jgi:hypothetical protein
MFCVGENGVTRDSATPQLVSREGGGGKTAKTVTYDDSKTNKTSVKTAVMIDPTSPDAVVEYAPTTDDNPDMGHLTDKWLENLDITNHTPLINALRQKLAKDGSSSVDSKPTTLIAELKNKQDIEDVRLGVTALETKFVWRSLQKVSNDVSFEFCQKAKSEWDSFGSRNNSEYNSNVNQIPENPHYGKCYFEQSETLEPSVITMESELSLQESSVGLTTLSDCIGFYDSWQSYRQLMLQAVKHTFFPDSKPLSMYLIHLFSISNKFIIEHGN